MRISQNLNTEITKVYAKISERSQRNLIAFDLTTSELYFDNMRHMRDLQEPLAAW